MLDIICATPLGMWNIGEEGCSNEIIKLNFAMHRQYAGPKLYYLYQQTED